MTRNPYFFLAAALSASYFAFSGFVPSTSKAIIAFAGSTAFLGFCIFTFPLMVVAQKISFSRSGIAHQPKPLLLMAIILTFWALCLFFQTAPTEPLHFLAYALLYTAAFRALQSSSSQWNPASTALACCALIACLDEGFQWLLPNRGFGFDDIARDILGSVMALACIRLGFNVKSPGRHSAAVILYWLSASILLGMFSLTPANLELLERNGVLPRAVSGNEETFFRNLGFRHTDSGLTFYSRLSRRKIQMLDAKSRESVRSGFWEAVISKEEAPRWTRVSSKTNPFLFEFYERFRFRDFNYREYLRLLNEGNPSGAQRHFQIAGGEERILQKFYPQSMNAISEFPGYIPPLNLPDSYSRYISPLGSHLNLDQSRPYVFPVWLTLSIILLALPLLRARLRTR